MVIPVQDARTRGPWCPSQTCQPRRCVPRVAMPYPVVMVDEERTTVEGAHSRSEADCGPGDGLLLVMLVEPISPPMIPPTIAAFPRPSRIRPERAVAATVEPTATAMPQPQFLRSGVVSSSGSSPSSVLHRWPETWYLNTVLIVAQSCQKHRSQVDPQDQKVTVHFARAKCMLREAYELSLAFP